jgi:hypothetical protein
MANFEYITNPQVFFGGLTALGPGIQGLTEQYPLLTTYQYWTSTSNTDSSVFPIPGTWSIYDGPNKEGSFLVTVGGIIQSPSEYSVDSVLRTLTFLTTSVPADIEIAVTQLATAAPSSQSLDTLKTINLTATNGVINSLYVTNLTALSTTVNIIDIQVSEVSGFKATGSVEILGNVNVSNNLISTYIESISGKIDSLTATNITTTQDFVAINATVTNLTASTGNLEVELLDTDSAIIVSEIVTDSQITNLTATNISDVTTANITDLTATNITTTVLNTNTAVATNLTATNAFITGLSATIHNYNLRTYASTTDADQTMDANIASRGSWIANFTANRALDILNLTEGREVYIYVRNTNGTARTITVRASTGTTTPGTGINFAREGAASVANVSLAISTGTAVFWVANINGTFVGSI